MSPPGRSLLRPSDKFVWRGGARGARARDFSVEESGECTKGPLLRPLFKRSNWGKNSLVGESGAFAVAHYLHPCCATIGLKVGVVLERDLLVRRARVFHVADGSSAV